MTNLFSDLESFDKFLGVLAKNNVSGIELPGIKVGFFDTEEEELTPAIGFSVETEVDEDLVEMRKRPVGFNDDKGPSGIYSRIPGIKELK